MKILIVDDSKFLRQLLKRMLGPHEYEEAANGDEASLTIQRFPAELVFLDIIMPGLNGVLTLEKIKQHRPEAKVVMQTSAGGADRAVQEAVRLGADDFLTKPYNQEDVDKILEKFNAKVIKEALPREKVEVSDEHAGIAES